MRRWLTLTRICLIFRRPCFGSSPSTGPGGALIWRFSSLQKAILNGEPIDVYNHGNMQRDFTYVEDLVEGIVRLAGTVPGTDPIGPMDSLSPVAPFRVVNIGNGMAIALNEFIAAIEAATGREAQRNLMPMQPGDVPSTWADASLVKGLVGTLPRTDIGDGVQQFLDWYRGWNAVE